MRKKGYSMKLAFLILAHQSPEILKRLVHALDDPRFDVFVHLDKKADAASFCFEDYHLRYSKLTILPKRYDAYWGGLPMTKAMLALYQYAFDKGDYAAFVMLSGEDYPVRSNDEIYRRITESPYELIRGVNLPSLNHVTGYWLWPLRRKRVIFFLRKALSKCGIQKKPYVIIDHKKWSICKASQWHALSRGCVAHILATVKRHPSLLRYFKYSFSADSLLFSTILLNSPEFKTKMVLHDQMDDTKFRRRPVLHYLKYREQSGSSVEIFDEKEFDAIRASDKLFVRKVRVGKSDKLLDLIDGTRQSALPADTE